jgi:uncharacterized protein YdhG (YjbR/CyaY superfamily)
MVSSSQTKRASTVDEYLAALGNEQRSALEKLRRDIHAAAPGAEDCISYRIPAVRLDGKVLVWYGAHTGHCAFYPGAVVQAHRDELRAYEISKGTIRFPAGKPLPATLVRKLVKARIAARG